MIFINVIYILIKLFKKNKRDFIRKEKNNVVTLN